MLMNGFEMSRRDFLSCTAAVAMMAASPFAGAEPAAGQPTTLITQRRTLGRASPLEVSAVGLGCLPMVGYYGGKFEKKDMVALIRRAFDEGCTFLTRSGKRMKRAARSSIRLRFMVRIRARHGSAKHFSPYATK